MGSSEFPLGETHRVQHPSTATATLYNNVGMTLQDKGDLDGAVKCLGKSLAVQEATSGEHHPDAATVYNNIEGCRHLGSCVSKNVEDVLKTKI